MNLATLFPSRRRRCWSDNETNLGPFTYAHDKGSTTIEVMLNSGGEESPGANLRLRAFSRTLIVWLPAWVLPPLRVKVKAETWDAATVARLGRDWYWDITERRFGCYLFEGHHFSVCYGAQTDDTRTEKRWSAFLPWNDWRHIRRSLYDAKGEHFWTDWTRPRGFAYSDSWTASHTIAKACPTVAFEFDDYDGKRIRATTRIEEREWRFGTKWCRWLSLFRRPRVRRSLDIEFSSEVGTEKGSWKGGTLGHGIEMLPGEMHEDAFRRYCAQDHRGRGGRTYRITYVGRLAA